MNYQCPANPKAKKGGHPNGGGNNSNQMGSNALNAAIYQMGVAQFLNQGTGNPNGQGNQPPQYGHPPQYPGANGSSPGFY